MVIAVVYSWMFFSELHLSSESLSDSYLHISDSSWWFCRLWVSYGHPGLCAYLPPHIIQEGTVTKRTWKHHLAFKTSSWAVTALEAFCYALNLCCCVPIWLISVLAQIYWILHLNAKFAFVWKSAYLQWKMRTWKNYIKKCVSILGLWILQMER